MKIFLVGVMPLLFLLQGCSQHVASPVVSEEIIESVDPITAAQRLEKLELSLARWEAFKESRGNSYQYTRSGHAGWAGMKSETVIIVYEDFVKARHFYEYDSSGTISANWKEDGFDALNSHDAGAPTKRIDDLYEDCRVILSTENDATLGLDTWGILSSCGTKKKGITVENLIFIYR